MRYTIYPFNEVMKTRTLTTNGTEANNLIVGAAQPSDPVTADTLKPASSLSYPTAGR